MRREAAPPPGAEFIGPLVGRDDELRRVHDLLEESQHRLVSITGRGGVGKTRLAIEVVRRLDERNPAAGVFVPLAAVSDPARVVYQIASTLGVHELPGVSIFDAVVGELSGRARVVVLDSFEHVGDAAPDVQRVLEACVNLRLLVTTQAPLRLHAERVLRLSGLQVDAAIALYCNRAAAVDADFHLTEDHAAAVEALCRELEGLPLAIELAAARAASLPAAAVLARIAGHSLDLLKADYHDAPERHRALRSAISWTYELLDEDAQRLVRHLTVTGGSFDLDDAEALAGDAAFDALGALVDLHLVDPTTDGTSTSYRMPDSIRQFAAEQLAAADDGEEAATTWLRSVAGRARAATIATDTEEEPSARGWLTAHQDELAAALTRCLDREDAGAAVDLLSALTAHWTVVGTPKAFQALLDRALDLAASAELTTSTYTETLAGACIALRWDSPARMRECLNEAEALAPSCSDARARLHVLAARVLSSAVTGDFDGSRDAALEGLAQADQLSSAKWSGRFEVWCGMIDHMRGDDAEAVRHGLAGLALARRTNDERMIIEASMLLIPLKAQLPHGGAELPPADEIVELTLRTGQVQMLFGLLPMLATDALNDGDVATATALCRDSLRRLRGYPRSPFAGLSLLCAARIAYTVGQHERVAYFHGAARVDIPLLAVLMPPKYAANQQRIVEDTKRELGAGAFDAAASRGETAGRAAAIDEALAWTEHLALTAPAEPPERIDLPGRSNEGALSQRQTAVLELVASGLANKEIAGRLGITRKTTEHHCEIIFRKLGVRGRTEATAWAHRHGIVAS